MNNQYAGFWYRFGSLIIDYCIIAFVQSIVFIPLLTAMGLGFFNTMSDMDSEGSGDLAAMIAVFAAGMTAYWILANILQLLYFSLMESSKHQATLGKMALGMKVTDMNGEKLDFTKAFLRNICKIISNFTMLIGYIMAGFTEKKQALHDMIAGTLVLKK
ncbi:MAG: RDD family protein [Cyclobacteriaceae bacterium]|nr:RDD family protein [Cyclobacteriaceae bacterium]